MSSEPAAVDWTASISKSEFYLIWATPCLFWLGFWIWLRIIDPPEKGSKQEKSKLKGALEPGVVNGQYDQPWYSTFDIVFLVFMVSFGGLCAVWTHFTVPELWSNKAFWIAQIPKLVCMLVVSVLGGIAARYFSGYYAMDSNRQCKFTVVDADGNVTEELREVATFDNYLLSKKGHWFQINYTRKLQHFAAYAVPVVFPHPPGCEGPLYLAWGDFFTMIGFVILIKPFRESMDCLMLQFHALDRPEDRPHTLKWIIGGNILPGLFLIVIFRYFLTLVGGDPGLALIFIMITGVGDGMAEPVGIAWGKHKYRTWSIDWRCCRRLTSEDLMELDEEVDKKNKTRIEYYEKIAESGKGNAEYDRIAAKDDKPKWRTLQMWTRSLEGSACVFLSSIIFTATSYHHFQNSSQFWFTMAVMPLPMTLAEAYSPHTMDTPCLMTMGGLILVAAVSLFPKV